MELSRQMAQRIVEEFNNVIPQKINLMDRNGVIIASSDPSRVGAFHEGAWLILTGRRNEVVVREDSELSGAMCGVNYPIVMDGQIAGVLGITGQYGEIVENARIIQRMTELLLSEAANTEQRLMGENVRNRFLDEWLNGDPKELTPAFVERGLLLDMDIRVPRRVMVCRAFDRDSSMETLRSIDLAEQTLKTFVAGLSHNNLFWKAASNLVCLVTAASDEEIERLAMSLCERVHSEFHLSLAVGIDDRQSGYEDMHQNYVKARRALAACMRTHKWSVRKYADLNMEVFSDEVDAATKQEYVRKIMRGFSDQEIAQLLPMLEVLYDNEGSIQRTSQQLFIHKNTLQYKLRRIAERTGYDPRSIRHSSLFYIAIYFYRDIRDSMNR